MSTPFVLGVTSEVVQGRWLRRYEKEWVKVRHPSGHELQGQHRCGRSRASGASMSNGYGRGCDPEKKAREVTEKAAPGGEIEGVGVVACLCSYPGV